MTASAKQKVQKYREYNKNGRFGILCQTHRIKSGYPPHRHDYIEFEVLTAGTLTHEFNGNRYTAQTGALWCLSTRDIHSIAVEQPATVYNICIDSGQVPSIVQQFLDSITFPRTGHFPSEVLPTVVNLLTSLQQALTETSRFGKERITGYILLLLSLFAEHSESIKPYPAASGYPRITEAVRYIATHFNKPLTLSEVAATVYLTPSYFSKVFAEETGYTFTEYVTFIRIEQAKRLLKETTLSIAVIAFRCGFTTFSSFSRQFRHLCGQTPTAYRKQSQEKP